MEEFVQSLIPCLPPTPATTTHNLEPNLMNSLKTMDWKTWWKQKDMQSFLEAFIQQVQLYRLQELEI